MRKILLVLLCVILTLSLFTTLASAFGGSGIEALARELSVIKTGLVGRKLSFSDLDFKSAFSIDDFERITVTSLPPSTEGTLLYAGRRVREGQDIKRRAIAAMVFVPSGKEISESSFSFRIDGGEEYEFRMRFIEKINYAPELAESFSGSVYLYTQRSVPVYGRIQAMDPEGDALEYILVAYPKRGSVEVGSDGRFIYTPTEEYVGYDSFSYVVRDEYGNYTEPVTVDLKVIERMSEIVYKDLYGKKEYNAAICMNALGIMSARQVGDDFYFDTERTVSKEEFVAAVLKARGIKPIGADSYFDDDDEISPSLKGYVARAQRMGIINGDYENGKLTFSPNEPITVDLASDIIRKTLGAPLGEVEYSAYNEVPSYMRGSVAAMVTLGVLESDLPSYTSKLTRGEVAEMIYRMVNNC